MTTAIQQRMLHGCLAIILWYSASFSACAAEPSIRNLDIRGLRVGGTTTLVLDGDDLGAAPRLLLPFPVKQILKPGSTDKKATFEVTLGDDVIPGYHHLRVVSGGGVSLPMVVGVDKLPQQLVTAPVTSLPVAIHGVVTGSGSIDTQFVGKAKQRVLVEVEAQRLGSKLRPIVHLYGPKKLQLAWAWAVPSLFGDTRLETVLPEDGTYTVSVHDVEYAAVAPSFFRLKIGEWSYVDQVYPPVISANKPATLELLGMATPVSVNAAATKIIEPLPLAWPKDGVWSGPRPFVSVSSRMEFVEQATVDNKPQEVPSGPVGVSGRLSVPYEEDRYRIAVTPGQKIRLEVFAERMGSPIDIALIVRNEQGAQLVRAEDSPGTLDPILEYTVPDKATAIVVAVVDAAGRGGPRGVYRLVIDPQTSTTTSESFKLTTTMQRLVLPASGRSVLPIHVERRGYLGKIEINAASPLPAGIQLTGGLIPEGADGTLVTIARTEIAFEPVIIHLRGQGIGGIEAPVTLKGHPLERLQPWLATEIALAPTNTKTSDFAVDWRDLPMTVGLVPGSKLVLPIKADRTNPKTSVKLTLLTSQPTPILNNAPDPNKALRPEKAVELPSAVLNGEITVLSPVELPAPSYDVAVQAELLAADKKVLAIAFTPVRRMTVNYPILVMLDGSNRFAAPFDPKKGTTIKIQGKIERREGLKADIALALTGLPTGAKADAITVKADATAFSIQVTLPPSIPVSEIKGVKLNGSFAPDGKQPNVRVRSRDVNLTLVIQASIP